MFVNNKFIKNSEYPACKNCKHYLEDKKSPNEPAFARCALFGDKNLLSGKIENYDLYKAQLYNYNQYCGPGGKYFVDSTKEDKLETFREKIEKLIKYRYIS
jgi:hypothetical protein